MKVRIRFQDCAGEEVTGAQQAPLPEPVLPLMRDLVCLQIDAERAQNAGALRPVPAVGKDDPAQVPEDGFDGTGCRLKAQRTPAFSVSGTGYGSAERAP